MIMSVHFAGAAPFSPESKWEMLPSKVQNGLKILFQLDTPSVQWFPGHMAKTRRLITENLYLVDIVAELRDARIPESSRNPEIARLAGKKPRIVLLNKCDTADERLTRAWCEFYRGIGVNALAVDCKSGKGLNAVLPLVRGMLSDELARREARGMAGKPLRMMVVGIPNVGKSSFINRMAGRKKTKVEDRPGVTRGKQWVALGGGVELLDMPGVLWPKFDDPAVGERLAVTGAIRDTIIDTELIAMRLLKFLKEHYRETLMLRYGLTDEDLASDGPEAELIAVCRRRGMLLHGGEYNTERAAAVVLDEFRGGKLGRITLEIPPKDTEENPRGVKPNESV